MVAAAGCGKTGSIDADLPPGGLRQSAASLLERSVPTVSWLGVDDLDALGPEQQAVVLDRIAALPNDVGVTIASRVPLEPALRSRLRGEFVERGPRDLALGPADIAHLLADAYGVPDPEAAARVHELTAGWPTLVHFAADVLAHRPDQDLHEALTGPATAAVTWLEVEVLGDVPPAVRDLLGLVGRLGPVTQDLCDTLAPGNGHVVDRLFRGGLLVPRRRLSSETLELVPVVAGALAATRRRSAGDGAGLLAAAGCHEGAGQVLAAALAFSRAGAHSDVVRLLQTHGEQMLRQGDAAAVARLVRSLPRSSRSALSGSFRLLYADALRMSGDSASALRELGPLVQDAERDGWTSALASSLAAVHYMRGDLQAALDATGRVAPGAVPIDHAGIELRACRVHVIASLGRADDARALAADTLAAAERTGDPRSLAVAHLAVARTSPGSRKEAHHEQALHAATTADDVATASRILVNQSCLLLAGARYGEAVIAAREAVRLAEVGSRTGRYAAALHNLGEALTRVGAYEEAAWQLQRANALCRRLGPGRAVGLLGLAEIHRELGHDEQARAAYEESAQLARAAGELQVLVPALAGLARVPTTAADAALAAAQEARRIAPPSLLPFALTALGWVAITRGDRRSAAGLAADADVAARGVHALDLLAEALELTAAATDDPEVARRALSEALAIWRSGGAVPGEARVQVLLGRLDHADRTACSHARDATKRLRSLGVFQVHGRPLTDETVSLQVAVRVLGGFDVRVDQRPVPLTAWRSRQARTLVKILAARRGRPVTRDRLCELLWPDADPARTGHRLSVLLATVRGVLDPQRAWPPDHYVAADLRGLWLDLRHVDLDADRLLRDAAVAAELMDAGDPERAREILSEVDARYHGPAFEDEPYEDWADGFREEVRASWQRSLRRLASLHSRQGRVADAQLLLVRLLASDPYDAPMHRLLVRTLARAGRHGEAERAFTRWADAMASIGAPPPDRGLLVGSVLTSR